MTLFASTTAPCGIFGPATDACAGGTETVLTFARAAHLLPGGMPVQNASGEIVVSFVPVGSVVVDLQPAHDGYPRTLGGLVVEVAYRLIALGVPNIRTGDRCYIDGKQLEVVTTNQYGSDHLEADLKWIGR